METKESIVTHLARIVQDSSYDDALLLDFANRARRYIAGRVHLPALRSEGTTITTAPGLFAVPMPDDYQRELFHCYDETESCRIKVFRSNNLMLKRYAHEADKDGILLAVAVEDTTPQEAKGTYTLADVPAADETLQVDSQTFTFKAARTVAGEITIGATAAATATNIAEAINADLTTVTAAASAATVVASSVAKNAAANDIVLTSSAANITADGSGTLGGTQYGVMTAWLRYLRSPTEAHSLTVYYFKRPVDLVDDTDIPSELPHDLQYDLIIRTAVHEIFEEIYSEDNPGVPNRWYGRREKSILELEQRIGPYAHEPELIHDEMDWECL